MLAHDGDIVSSSSLREGSLVRTSCLCCWFSGMVEVGNWLGPSVLPTVLGEMPPPLYVSQAGQSGM